MSKLALSASSKGGDGAAAKRARLNELSRGSYVSASGKVALLTSIKDHGLPEHFSRSTLRRARHVEATQLTPYGPIVQDMELPCRGGELVAVQHPLAMFWAACDQSESFAYLVRDTLAHTPCSPADPWTVILYFDEVSPNNPLARGKDLRKVQAVYWSLLEFGVDALENELVWFTISATRSDLVNALDGGMSELIKLLWDKFWNRDDHNFATSGITVNLKGVDGEQSMAIIFGAHGITVADFLAHVQLLGSKGHQGTVPCPCCRNVYDHGAELVPKPGLVPLTCVDCSRWLLHTDASVKKIIARLQAIKGTVSNTRYKEIEQQTGWGYNPHNILTDPQINYKPVSTLMYDWMHTLFGIFSNEVKKLLAAMKAYNRRAPPVSARMLHNYMQAWQWPRQFPHARNIFATGEFSATASEMLSAAPVLAHFFRDFRAQGLLVAEVDSFLAVCHVVELLQGVSRKTTTPEQLQVNIVDHLTKYQASYGADGWVFKHHMAGHLAGMFKKFGTLIALFLHERHHKEIKRALKDHLNTAGYERSVLEEVTNQHLHNLRQPVRQGHCLINGHSDVNVERAMRELHPHVNAVLVAVSAYVGSVKFCKGDVVLHGADNRVGQIWYIVDLDGSLHVCVSVWEVVARGTRWARARIDSAPELILISALRCALIAHMSGEFATAVLPLSVCSV